MPWQTDRPDYQRIAQHRTTVDDLLGESVMPSPVTPVPFEKFAHLKESEDMLQRAAFWAFYAAWQQDSNGVGPADIPVEARHDGHTLQMISQQLHLRDCVLMRRDHLEAMQQRLEAQGGAQWAMCSFLMCAGIVVGVLIALVAKANGF